MRIEIEHEREDRTAIIEKEDGVFTITVTTFGDEVASATVVGCSATDAFELAVRLMEIKKEWT